MLNPMPVKNSKEVKAHPKSMAVIGVEAASMKVKNNQEAAPT
jgi:hypothetical protein